MKLARVQKFALTLVFLTGVFLHAISIIIGREKFLQNVFTPAFDMTFSIPMIFAGIVGILSWKKMDLSASWKKILYGFCIFYVLISIPLHAKVFFTQDTNYINDFPETFSYFIIPVQGFFAWFALTMKIKSSS
jgi:hypothetical protein